MTCSRVLAGMPHTSLASFCIPNSRRSHGHLAGPIGPGKGQLPIGGLLGLLCLRKFFCTGGGGVKGSHCTTIYISIPLQPRAPPRASLAEANVTKAHCLPVIGVETRTSSLTSISQTRRKKVKHCGSQPGSQPGFMKTSVTSPYLPNLRSHSPTSNQTSTPPSLHGWLGFYFPTRPAD